MIAKIDQWHPFAEKFPLLQGAEWEAFKADIHKTKGPEQKVAYRLVDGKKQGLDGRNRERACEELGLECRMEPVEVADDDVVDFIVRRNVLRRHMTTELRREIVAELRASGKSTRTIAATIGVSKSTVHSDIEAAESGVQNRTPDSSKTQGKAPDDDKKPASTGKVTGSDGKTYSATKPKAAKVLCDRCKRVGAVEDCERCAEARATKPATTKPPKPPKAGKPVFDDRPFEQLYGKLIRFFDQRKSAYGFGAKDKVKEHDEIMEAMGFVLAGWKRWQKAST